MPFDQHYLIASTAPRCVLVGSATEDAWADPISEQLSCLAAAPAFGGDFQCDRPAQPDECFLEGKLAITCAPALTISAAPTGCA